MNEQAGEDFKAEQREEKTRSLRKSSAKKENPGIFSPVRAR
jgi:hypothetical protein